MANLEWRTLQVNGECMVALYRTVGPEPCREIIPLEEFGTLLEQGYRLLDKDYMQARLFQKAVKDASASP